MIAADRPYAIYDEQPDFASRQWRLVKGAPCPICGRAPLRGDQLGRELTAIREVAP